MGADSGGFPARLHEALWIKAPLGVAVLDAQRRYRWLNEIMADFNGVSVEAHLGRTVAQVLPDIADDVLPMLEHVIRTGTPVRDVEVDTGPTAGQPGRPRRWRVSYVPLDNDDLAVFAVDVTERAEAQQARSLQLYRTERFAVLAAAIAAAVSIDDIADAVHELAGTALSATSCGLALRDGEGLLTFAGHAAAGRDGRWTPMNSRDDVPLAAVLAGGRALYLPDPAAMLDRWPHLAGLQQLTGDRSWAALPLSDATGTAIGVLTVAFPAPRTFAAEDRQYLESVAILTSQGLQRALAHHREHSIADTLQRALLPERLPAVPGLQAASRYHAASNTADVGGDFYDLFPTGPDTVTAAIGDVCQKGLTAAAQVAQARHSLRALAATADGPATALRHLNDVLRPDMPLGRFLTCTCVRVTLTPPMSLTVACGGHPAPLLILPDRTVQPIDAPGTLLGAFADITLREQTVPFPPGAALLLYTDGIIEAQSPAGQYGEQRLIDHLRQAPDLHAEALADHVLSGVTAFTTQLRDDIALLVLHATTDGPHTVR
ncbi:serine phosphatase RsbU (regulator of sigma subunit) [Catenuloplanes nepalensis]|uniref:Serine phosphatase RsbU (Regulator of sigma subunit) n=1 Tax=Catenuloplanes nepalensis TaxID=587533 RepID=A0ABT9MRW4_9ACTN|nr:SpoIIE family protein phosphatase [Catenuloplanes nepalensis]MDP9794182.1 serine phosphatase RsbU (regulator of sigma subunit) [Catenuloplanes nepalensis]